MNEREEAFYFHVLCDFVDLIEEHGVERVARDLKATSPTAFEALQKIVLLERDRTKTAAILQYKDAFFADYGTDTNN